jgi:tetratricopeptide (TPR) repeat protein
MDDLFAIQDDIARNIARQLEVTLASNSSQGRLVKPTTDNLDAYELYLKGRYLLERRGEGLGQGLELFQRAIQLDPEYAIAHAGVAEGLCLLAVYGVLPADQIMPRAREAARRALELDDTLAEGHNAHAMVSVLHDWDWERAEREFTRAIELSPSYAAARYWYGLLYLLFVRDQPQAALREVTRAVDLDPLAVLPLYAYGLVLAGARMFEQAAQRIEKGLEQHPTAFILHRVLGIAYFGLGKHQDAIAALEKGMVLSNRHPWLASELGAVYAAVGREGEADMLHSEILARCKSSHVSAITLAVIPLALGRIDEGLDFLDAAYESREPLLIVVPRWPTFDPLREHPRYHDLLRRLRLVG